MHRALAFAHNLNIYFKSSYWPCLQETSMPRAFQILNKAEGDRDQVDQPETGPQPSYLAGNKA